MFGAKNNIHHFILLLSVSSFLIAPVSSIKCYECVSILHEDCEDNPKQTKFEVVCKEEGKATDNTEYECLRGSLTLKDPETGAIVKMFMRGCMKKGKECHPDNAIDTKLSTTRDQLDTTIHWCDTCDSDLCNSTALLSAEMWILTLSLIIQLQWQ